MPKKRGVEGYQPNVEPITYSEDPLNGAAIAPLFDLPLMLDFVTQAARPRSKFGLASPPAEAETGTDSHPESIHKIW